jgi:hypothetical protein
MSQAAGTVQAVGTVFIPLLFLTLANEIILTYHHIYRYQTLIGDNECPVG